MRWSMIIADFLPLIFLNTHNYFFVHLDSDCFVGFGKLGMCDPCVAVILSLCRKYISKVNVQVPEQPLKWMIVIKMHRTLRAKSIKYKIFTLIFR